MYLPPHFAEHRTEVLHALVRRHPLGLLVTQGADAALVADNLPFLLDDGGPGGNGVLRAHVARANPLWQRARTDVDSLVVFQGAQAYVSPSFYPSKAEHGRVVPTWNYIVVQARGRLRVVDDADRLHALVTRLTDRHESPRVAPWAVTDAPAGFVATQLRAIVGIEIELTALEGKWKVGQNRSAVDRAGVAEGLRQGGHADAEALAGAAPDRDVSGAASPPANPAR